MSTEIREYGDHQQVVVHTDDPVVVRRLQAWKHCQRVQAYECGPWQEWPCKLAVVACDFYFLRDHERRVRRDLQQLGIEISESRALQKKGGQTALLGSFRHAGEAICGEPEARHVTARRRQKRGPNGLI